LVPALALSVRGLDDMRLRNGLAESSPLEVLAPGKVASIALLGGFRGLCVDYLWYRAESRLLEPAPDLHDLPMLYDLIAGLQPHYPEMWYYVASRMAFDIPNQVPYPTGESDWLWCRRGLEHLERGIQENRASPQAGKLRFYLAEIYHRRCTPDPTARSGATCYRRLKETRGEDAFERIAGLVHSYREDPGTLPAWTNKAAHAWTEAAVQAPSLEQEDSALASAEWDWVRAFYRRSDPANRWLRERPGYFRAQVPVLEARFLAPLARKRQAISLEREGRLPEALALWAALLRRTILDGVPPDPLCQKHLRQAGRLAEAYETLADLLEGDASLLPETERRERLIRDLREAALRERARGAPRRTGA
jgi:hypothetical protein